MTLYSHSRDNCSSLVLHISALKLREWRHIQIDNESIKNPLEKYPETKLELDYIANSCSIEDGTMRPDAALSGSVRAFLPDSLWRTSMIRHLILGATALTLMTGAAFAQGYSSQTTTTVTRSTD